MDPWDILAESRYSDLTSGRDVTFTNILFPTILQILLNEKRGNEFSILDVGCHIGYLTGLLSEHATHITGIDPSANGIQRAKGHLKDKANVLLNRITLEEYTRQTKRKFDFVIAHMTLQVIEDLKGSITNIASLLRPGGGFLFSIPHPCFWALIKEEIGHEKFNYQKPSSHKNRFKVGDQEVEVPYYHRPLARYSECLFTSGFVIERMFEPFPDDEDMKLYPRSWIYPGFLFTLCRLQSESEIK
ncbi:MAG: class I SAM-dependent methyltransferase [Anaerolineales bacterium]